MTQEEAIELARPYYNTVNNIVVASDGSIYLSPDINYVLDHCKAQNLEAFIVKGEIPSIEQIEESPEQTETNTDTPKKKK